MRHRSWMHGLIDRRDGAAAVEFAIVFPLFAMVILGGLGFGMAMLNLNALQSVVTQAARCLAIAGSDCNTAVAGCSDTNAQCYIKVLSQKQGLSGVTASQMNINTAYAVGSATFTRVQITYPMSLAGYTFSLSATAQFPNS